VTGAESGPIVELDQLQAVFVLLGERTGPVVVLIEYAELHRTTLPTSCSTRRDESCSGYCVW